MTGVSPSAVPVADDYLARTVQALWPGVRTTITRPSRDQRGAGDGWFVFPSPSRPRMLVPVDCRAAAVMLNRHDSSRREAWGRAVLRAAVASGWLRRLPVRRLLVHVPGRGDDDFAGHLGDVLGQPVRIGVLLGPVRANAKPVVQAFSGSGRTLAFAKVDVGGTGDLVDREASALSTLAAAGLATVEPPTLLHHGRWQGHAVTVLSPLDASQSRNTDDEPELAAAAEIAAVGGLREVPYTDALSRLHEGVVGLSTGTGRDRISAALGLLEEQRLHGPRTVTVGSWHGDWSPWNMRRATPGTGRLQVWDWERFDTGVAYGLDAVHHRAQLLWRDGVAAGGCREPLEHAARTMPAPAGHRPVPADLLRVLYLVEVATRYLRDQPPGGPPRPRTRWILDQLTAGDLRKEATP